MPATALLKCGGSDAAALRFSGGGAPARFAYAFAVRTKAIDPGEDQAVVLADNRRALFDYHIERRVEAGIVLLGTEIKSLRAGQGNLREGYARIEKGEAWLRGVHIATWKHSSGDDHEPTRPRKLLLHRTEIDALAGEQAQKGYTIVPLRLYTKNGRAKVELGLGRGKKRYDKRQAIKERETKREMQLAVRRRLGRG